jgi:hypothetical protein
VKLKESFIVKKFGPNARLDVRFRGQTGKYLLVLSFSGFEPKWSFGALGVAKSESLLSDFFSLRREGFLTVHPLRLLGKYTPAGRHFFECSLYGLVLCLCRSLFGVGRSLSTHVRP